MNLSPLARLVVLLLLAAGIPLTPLAQTGTTATDDPLYIDDLVPEAVTYEHLYEGRMKGPYGVACDGARGEIYLADRGGDLIGIFNFKGASLFAFSDPGRLAGPTALVSDRRGRLWVLDQDGARVKQYSYRGEFQGYVPLTGLGDRKELQFTAIARDPEGNLYLGESVNGEVLIFDPQGKLKRAIGSKGMGPGQFMTIQGIAVTGDTIYVADAMSLGIQLFDRYGRYLRGWGKHDAGTANVSLPAGIAVDEKGRIFLSDTLRHEVKVYKQNGQLIGQYGGAGSGPGEFMYPGSIGVDGKGRVCVADKGNNRLQVLAVREPGPPPVVRRSGGAAAPPPAPPSELPAPR
jgi:DNA-binding beta-propeller fold protein YncE